MSKGEISLHSCSLAVDMSKRNILLNGCSTHGHAAAKRPADKRKQHLYLVLDDWEKGYSVRKVGVDALDHADDGLEPEGFSEPPLARFDVVHGYSHAFVVHGTKIVAMKPHEVSPAIPVLDTDTSAVGILPWPEFRMTFGRPLLISIAGKLFLFIKNTHYLADPPPPPSPPSSGWEIVYAPAVQKPWVWTNLGSPSVQRPFTASTAHCYALHPDGHTLVLSAGMWRHKTKMGTFSFDTERLEWTRRGDWQLLFRGQAHYVAQLDAWVGLCHLKGGVGHLCSSDVVAVDDAAGPTTLP